ncbi:hypothetical protein BJ741DRAFT_583983 [Chytriomyces cf. hyalinus JEL632]|nr:hypothetical protein BJ741DRAFT_583983 [Chytriomyces cf. hyalinus JEL632]
MTKHKQITEAADDMVEMTEVNGDNVPRRNVGSSRSHRTRRNVLRIKNARGFDVDSAFYNQKRLHGQEERGTRKYGIKETVPQLAAARLFLERSRVGKTSLSHKKEVSMAELEKPRCNDTEHKQINAVHLTDKSRVLRESYGPKPGLNPFAAEFVPASARGLNVHAEKFYPAPQPCFLYYPLPNPSFCYYPPPQYFFFNPPPHYFFF